MFSCFSFILVIIYPWWLYMKKFCIALIGLVILVAVSLGIYLIFFNKPGYLKIELPFQKDDGNLLGIMYIGGLEEDYDYTIVDKYFKTRDFETIELGGKEKYLIIPRECEMEVYSLSMDEVDEEDFVMKEKYIKTMNKPFYITCNVSDIIANSLLRVNKDGKQYSYSPYISLKDGSVFVEDFVLEIE